MGKGVILMKLDKKGLLRPRKWLLGLLLLLVILAVSGCKTMSFYAQAVKGQYQLWADAEPVEKLMASTNTSAKLKARLELVRTLRDFADKHLELPVDGHYLKYVDLHRPYAVWNVEAAPEFSMAPKTWWYPLVGSLEYRGYFSEKGARSYGKYLQKKGYDVFVGGAEAYSTLGWFKDPLLNTFIFDSDPDLAELLFHELGHQRVFAHGDTDFNEAFATTVGQEGARRWLHSRGDTNAYSAYVEEVQRTRDFAGLIMQTRTRLEALFGDERTKDGKIKATDKNRNVDPEELRRRKQELIEKLRQEYAALKPQWGGNTEYDGWFTDPINNAQLNSVAAYYDLVPGFERLLEQNGGDMGKFYEAAERLAKMGKAERQESLRSLGSVSGNRIDRKELKEKDGP
jgi:predicted aminopeptidase